MSWRLTRKAGRRLSWGIADQAVSSLTNFAVNIVIARELGAVQYGAFALAYVTYGFALQASRGLATDPLLVRFSGTDVPTWRRAVASCTGTATVTGLATGICVLAAAAVLGGPTRLAFLALGLTLPALLLQDSSGASHGCGLLGLWHGRNEQKYEKKRTFQASLSMEDMLQHALRRRCALATCDGP